MCFALGLVGPEHADGVQFSVVVGLLIAALAVGSAIAALIFRSNPSPNPKADV
jgi:hypothetical protein